LAATQVGVEFSQSRARSLVVVTQSVQWVWATLPQSQSSFIHQTLKMAKTQKKINTYRFGKVKNIYLDNFFLNLGYWFFKVFN